MFRAIARVGIIVLSMMSNSRYVDDERCMKSVKESKSWNRSWNSINVLYK